MWIIILKPYAFLNKRFQTLLITNSPDPRQSFPLRSSRAFTLRVTQGGEKVAPLNHVNIVGEGGGGCGHFQKKMANYLLPLSLD